MATTVSTTRYGRSRALFAESQQYLAGGNSRLTVFFQPHPLFMERGSGARIYDVDGNEYLDIINNYTSLIHGHAQPEVVEAAVGAVRSGTAFAAPTPPEVGLGKLICERIPAVERVRFVNSGTEAVMMAVKAARAYTGKPAIAKFEGAYHGAYDFVEVSLASAPQNWGAASLPVSTRYAAGQPQSVLDEVVALPFNQLDRTLDLLRRNQERLAAVLVDAMPSRVGLIPGSEAFLQGLQSECRALGILLILDEVISLRLGYHGAQGELGLEPDLTTMAKIIGGGFPVGAVGGKEAVMSVFDPTTGKPALPHGGTFNANPVTMAAGLRAMELMTPEEFDRINALGEQARRGLADVVRLLEVDWQVTGAGSLFKLVPSTEPLSDYRSAFVTPEQAARIHALHWALLDRGIFMGHDALGCISTPMTEADVEQIIHAVEAALRQVEE
ncbi:MAG TPA: aspartate aminotransferase family protein [Candidatus Limnocylindria bacterium]|nr:aspartate aminotransferase family protein [Candidatus Limnocylindria bacterium]